MKSSGAKRATVATIAVLAVAGLIVRLSAINASLWLDEFSTLWAIDGSVSDVVHRVPGVMGQSPFYFVIDWLSIRLFGESELALRLPSLLAIVIATLAAARAATIVAGRRAGLWTGGLLWLCSAFIWESVNARPYALALACTAIALCGFIRAVSGHSIGGRLLFVFGSAGLVWTHYVFLPFWLALPVAYALSPSLRTCYPVRQFTIDVGIILALLIPALPHLLEILRAKASVAWMFAPKYLAVTAVLVPFLLAALMPARRTLLSQRQRPFLATLWLAIGFQFAALQLATFAGWDLSAPRYAEVCVVGLAIIAGVNLQRISATDRVAPVTVFGMISVPSLIASHQITGSWSGAGYQDWRSATAAVITDIQSTPDAPVLFRSGNFEDDLFPPGEIRWGATLAPLRSPGQKAPALKIVLLTYRWTRPERAGYFESTVRTRLEHEPVFYSLCLTSEEPESGGYCARVEQWVLATWPGTVRSRSLGRFRQLSATRFERR